MDAYQQENYKPVTNDNAATPEMDVYVVPAYLSVLRIVVFGIIIFEVVGFIIKAIRNRSISSECVPFYQIWRKIFGAISVC